MFRVLYSMKLVVHYPFLQNSWTFRWVVHLQGHAITNKEYSLKNAIFITEVNKWSMLQNSS